MSKSTSLRRSPELKAAARAIAGLNGCLYLIRKGDDGEDRCWHIHGTVNRILEMGVPSVIEGVDQRLELHRQLLTVVYNFARFLMDHPAASVLIPQNFSLDSREYEVLSHIQDIVAYDEMDDAQREIWTGDPDLVDKMYDPPVAEDGTLLHLVEHIVQPKDAHLRRANVWEMIAVVEPRVSALVEIKALLEPLTEGAAL